MATKAVKDNFKKDIDDILRIEFGKTVKEATNKELYYAVSRAGLLAAGADFQQKAYASGEKKVCYLSAEFLIGRMVYNNLVNLDLYDAYKEYCGENSLDVKSFEDIEDAALGNGGLGRLAACFLDSGATQGINLNGYGIRYKYGLFKQSFENGFQKESPDDWMKAGDPWSIRHEEDSVIINFKDFSVRAVPYDMPVIGYQKGNSKAKVNTLRLWQAEAVEEFDFEAFNDQKYDKEAKARTKAYDINAVLYPNDTMDAGKRLRLRQQYFFSAATIADILRNFKKLHAEEIKNAGTYDELVKVYEKFSEDYAVQLNDTHPSVSVPEFLRLLNENEGIALEDAKRIAFNVFSYTNHTIMAEALEKWSVKLFKSVIPELFPYIKFLEAELEKELGANPKVGDITPYKIIDNNTIHMARMDVYATHSVNGVAAIHTQILKDTALNEWYQIYPERFYNETNGITQRRWLLLSNPQLSSFIEDKIGSGFATDLDELKKLEKLADDKKVIEEFDKIKKEKKQDLADYVKKMEGVDLDTSFIFDIMCKRLHEYKRELLNAFSIMDIYFGIKEGRIKNFNPTAFIFGAKAAPGYFRAKGIIKYINEIAKLIDGDADVKDKLKVLFVHDYNVSYAEKLTPAADVSEQISTAGTEASGTGNMKFMLNGAVTLGTFDGANVEIVEEAGEENNYIFGARVEDLEKIKDSYDPNEIYKKEKRIKRVIDTLVDGTFDDGGTGMFGELHDALLKGASWHQPDHYYLLLDFLPYVEAKLKANADYSDVFSFRRKCFINTANAGKFSSDRTILGYAKDIWKCL